jgi:hypothetical protein
MSNSQTGSKKLLVRDLDPPPFFNITDVAGKAVFMAEKLSDRVEIHSVADQG